MRDLPESWNLMKAIHHLQDHTCLEKLCGSTLIALGSQANAKGVSNPADTVVFALVGPGSCMSKQFCRDSEKMAMWVMLSHESVRARKKINRGSNATSQRVEMTLFTEKPFGMMVPEMPRIVYAGYTHGDAIGPVTALAPDKLWRLPRAEKEEIVGARKVTVPPGEDPDIEGESVFSCAVLPMELYQEVIHSTKAQTVVDLSPGQGECCKAALALRVPIVAICGSEAHSQRLELLLTEYIFQEQRRESSTFYRAEACEDNVDAKEE
ncbi:hypothetical protein AK812_SmicGene10330 [Symbiodinium microadriaticum]|uniref:Uncharacterized protein n=1 Tax=Symbiodinium microadriaticum TaxID=2951 RepID=A0A1Q9EG36_SYMMI|nr:hypothetical protein AK812_SmicGene10330 [Symbiodinium microadriaticum]